MFFFGDPEQVARTIIESISEQGPNTEGIPVSEMSEETLMNSLVMYRLGLKEGFRVDAGVPVIQVLTRWHDERLEALVGMSESFRARVESGKYKTPKEYLEKREAVGKSESES